MPPKEAHPASDPAITGKSAAKAKGAKGTKKPRIIHTKSGLGTRSVRASKGDRKYGSSSSVKSPIHYALMKRYEKRIGDMPPVSSEFNAASYRIRKNFWRTVNEAIAMYLVNSKRKLCTINPRVIKEVIKRSGSTLTPRLLAAATNVEQAYANAQ